MNKPIKKSTPSLFDLVAVSNELKNQLIEGEGVLSETLEQDLIKNSEQLEGKAVAYAYTIDSIKADIEQLKQMEKQIRERKKALENSVSRISGALLSGLISCEVKKIEGAPYRITVGKKRAFVNYINEEQIPEEYIDKTYNISEQDLKGVFKYVDNKEAYIDSLVLVCSASVSSSITTKINKADILADLKEGKEISGVSLIDTDKQLYIK